LCIQVLCAGLQKNARWFERERERAVLWVILLWVLGKIALLVRVVCNLLAWADRGFRGCRLGNWWWCLRGLIGFEAHCCFAWARSKKREVRSKKQLLNDKWVVKRSCKVVWGGCRNSSVGVGGGGCKLRFSVCLKGSIISRRKKWNDLLIGCRKQEERS
jgi:hypothetical protein